LFSINLSKGVDGGIQTMMDKNAVDMAAHILVIIGGINWGLVGLVNFNLVQTIFGSVPVLQQIVYVLVGLSALYMVYAITKK